MTRILVWIAITALAVACGEGGTGGTGLDSKKPTITTFAIGAISANDGSVATINGVEYALSSTKITINDVDARASDLKPGMVARIAAEQGEQGNIARSVTVLDMVSGRISRVNDGVATVNAQKVLITDQTRMEDGLTPTDLQFGLHVAAMGMAGVDGTITATYVRSVQTTAPIWISGNVSQLGEQTFVLGAMTVDFSAASPLPSLVEGAFVSVRGQLDARNQSLLHANAVWNELSALGAPTEAIEWEGTVQGVAAHSLTLWGHAIFSDDATQIRREDRTAATWSAIEVGTRVRLWAHPTQGRLIADTIEFRSSGTAAETRLRDTATVRSMVTDYTAGALKLAGLTDTQFVVDDTTVWLGFNTQALFAGYTVRVQLDKSLKTAPWHVARLVLLEKQATEDIDVVTQVREVDPVNSPVQRVRLFDNWIDLSTVRAIDPEPLKVDNWVQLQGTYKNAVTAWNEIGAP